MKFCLIGPGIMEIPPKGWGAVESLIWEYAEALRQFGHEVDIINVPDRNEIIKLENNKIYDVTHVHYDVFYEILPYMKAKKVLISSHYPYVDQKEKHAQDDYGRIYDYMIKHSDKYKIAAISSKDANAFIADDVAPWNIMVIPNGVNLNKITCNHQLGPMSFAAVCLAKIENRKRQHITFPLPNVYYIGKGPCSHPNYLGELSQEDKEQKLTNFGCMILLSNGENSTPLAIKEGMAAGLNIIVSEQASSEILGLKFVTVIPDHLVYDTQYIQKIIIESSAQNIKDRESIRKYCQENWSWEKLVEDYVKKVSV